MSIRLGRSEDGPEFIRLVDLVLREYGLRGEPDQTDACLQNIQESYFDRGGSFEVIVDSSDHIVGGYGLYPLSKEAVELRKMYFTANIRGKGLGKWVLQRAVGKSRELGFKRVELETASVLVEACHLYEKFGFVKFSKDHLPHRCDEAWVYELD